jgi:hypothetical protein
MKEMIRLLETLFPKTMRKFWFQARKTGRTAGINEAIALIYAEIRVLSASKSKSDVKTQERISELVFILASLKKRANDN